MTDQDQIAEFLARKGVTKCPPGEAKAKSLRQMAREFDRPMLQEQSSEYLWEMGFVEEAKARVRGC